MLKSTIKKLLRNFGKFLPQLPNNMIVKKFSDPNAHVFFGYYDITPFNYSNDKILACQVPIKNSSKNIVMDLGYYNLDKNKSKFFKFGETNAWCWQMGPRLRWLHNDSEFVAYNSLVKKKYVCKLQDLKEQKAFDVLPLALYDINKDQSYGLSLNFSRLQRLRPGYGYKNLLDQTVKLSAPSNDGITLYDFNSRKSELLISLFVISKIDSDETMLNAEHYFNHISFCPFSNTFMFFHLWLKNNRRYSRLFTYNLETCKYKLISKNRVSHYAWKSKDQLLITESKNKKVFFTLYNVNDGSSTIVGENILNNDGHPSFYSMNGIIYDSYPNIFGNQKLFFYDFETQPKPKSIYRLFSPPQYTGENKCDLHPRLSRDKKFICLDSAMSGKREIYIIRLSSTF